MYFFLPGNSSGGGGSSTGAGALTVVSPEKKKIEEYYKNLLWDWFFLKSKATSFQFRRSRPDAARAATIFDEC